VADSVRVRSADRPKATNGSTAKTAAHSSYSNRLPTNPIQLQRLQESCLNLQRSTYMAKSLGIH